MNNSFRYGLMVCFTLMMAGCAKSSILDNHREYSLIDSQQSPIYSKGMSTCSKTFNTADYYTDPEAYQELLNWHLQSPEAHKPSCQNNIGWLYYVIERDYQKARGWFSLAAKEMDLNASFNLALSYDQLAQNNDDYSKAFVLYWLVANEGHKFAQNNLAQLYMRGDGIMRNFERANYWLNKSATNGYSLAFVHLGNLYEKGYGVAQDYQQAANYYEKAAELEDHIGELRLALLYLNGLGVEKNESVAKELLRSSAARGNSSASFHLSLLSG
ncbi:tetratricopeptide repeat protein [Photobacterium sp. MCCC 1A19761]|uniref:tetratricopeptide repeat protein n=1 Tax=Photobacterium sp. MCCC 1A19761 TaxID=3115000 RepID=UPI00307DBB7C